MVSTYDYRLIFQYFYRFDDSLDQTITSFETGSRPADGAEKAGTLRTLTTYSVGQHPTPHLHPERSGTAFSSTNERRGSSPRLLLLTCSMADSAEPTRDDRIVWRQQQSSIDAYSYECIWQMFIDSNGIGDVTLRLYPTCNSNS